LPYELSLFVLQTAECGSVINWCRCYELFMQQPQGAHFVAALWNFFPSLGSMSAALGLHQAIRSDAIRSDPNGRPWSWVSAGSLLSLNVSIDIADYTGQQG